MDETDGQARIYELSYLLVPFLEDTGIQAELIKIKDKLASLSALTISEEAPKMIPLAYQMTTVIDNKNQRFTSGHFGWVKFEMDPASIPDLEAILKRNEAVIRYLIIKTVRENTLAAGRPMRRPDGFKKKPEGSEAPVNKEEMDKKIEALVV